MAGLPGIAPSGQTLNPQFLQALQLVDAIRLELQALLPLAQIVGNATVNEEQIRRWEATLSQAVQLIASVPVILIFPPPPFVEFANAARAHIERAIETLRSVLTSMPRPFLPQPGRVRIPLQTLQSVIGDLVQAETFLVQALRSA